MALDLSGSRFFGPLIRNPLWRSIARWGLLAALFAVIMAAWGRVRLPGVADPYPLLYTNAATLLFWVVWFMGIVLLAPALGRAWCSVCPLGFIAEKSGNIGMNLQWPGKTFRRILVVFVFGAGLLAALYFDAHKSPHLTALTVGGAALLALAAGLLWRRAAFCGFFCPVGTVLSLYGRYSPLKVAPKDESACSACAGRNCVKRESSWNRWDMGSLVVHKKTYSSGCPVALDPPTMDAAECLLCMECVRKCHCGNLGVFYGRRTSQRPLSASMLLMLAPLSGLVILVLIRTWPELRDSLAPGNFPPVALWAAWFGLVVPLVLILSGALVEWLGEKVAPAVEEEPAGDTPGRGARVERRGFLEIAARVATPFAGPVLGAHMAVALVKLNAKIAYVPYLFYDPFGGSTYMAIHVTKALPLPPMVVPMAVLRIAAPALLALGVGFGLWDAGGLWRGKLRNGPLLLSVAGFAALSGLYGATLIHWLMAGR